MPASELKECKPSFSNKRMLDILKKSPFIPVLSITDLEIAVPLVKALSAGGVNVVEIALRTPEAFDAIKLLRKECPDVVVGAATVMSTKEMDEAMDAGAQFGASPMFDQTKALLNRAKERGFTYMPCVSNLSEIHLAASEGFPVQKLFPMDAFSDGEKFLRGTQTMANKLSVTFCTSCLETESKDMDKYLKFNHVQAVASGWSIPANLIATRDWEAITKLAQQDVAHGKHILAKKDKPVLPLSESVGPQKRVARIMGHLGVFAQNDGDRPESQNTLRQSHSPSYGKRA